MKIDIMKYILISAITIIMVGGIVTAGSLITSIGVDRKTEDKIAVIVGEKKITEELFVKDSVVNEVERYNQEKVMQVRIALNQEMSKCVRSNNYVQIEECSKALNGVNAKYQAPIKEGEVIGEQILP
jgi:hypothetical protein